MMPITDARTLKISCSKLLIAIQLIVFAGWFIQLVLHQTWTGISTSIDWNLGFYCSLLISLIPLTSCALLIFRRPSLPTISIDYRDIATAFLLLLLAILCWWVFAKYSIYYPMHTYGDEDVHFPRVQLMVDDFWRWVQYTFQHGNRPEFRPEYMMYPALAYVPNALWAMVKGGASSFVDQRVFLSIHYLTIVLASFLLARLFIKSRIISFLVAMIPLSSALLISYTMTFYIEMQYVSVLIASFWLLAWGIRRHSNEIVFTAVLVSSIAPILRESAIGATGGILLSAMLWRYFNGYLKGNRIYRALSAIGYFVIGALPFAIYYLAKLNYSDRDTARTSLAFIFQQDYIPLFTYSVIYLGPIALIAILFFIFKPKYVKREPYLILAAICGIGGGLALQAIFLPGYMPWSRNYLFCYADFMLLIILCVNFIYLDGAKGKKIGISLLVISVLVNYSICIGLLHNNNYFHETENIFDIRSISNYMTEHKQDFAGQKVFVYWPRNFMAYPADSLPNFINLTKITTIGLQSRFLEFDIVRHGFPADSRYILFYYLKNDSRPARFHNIPSVKRPSAEQLQGYRVLVETTDLWSNGRNGVMLLERGVPQS